MGVRPVIRAVIVARPLVGGGLPMLRGRRLQMLRMLHFVERKKVPRKKVVKRGMKAKYKVVRRVVGQKRWLIIVRRALAQLRRAGACGGAAMRPGGIGIRISLMRTHILEVKVTLEVTLEVKVGILEKVTLRVILSVRARAPI